MSNFRENWLGWNKLKDPREKGVEGNTGKYNDYQNSLFNLVKELKPKNILEIGFNAGHSACCFLNASPDSKMITFDCCRWGYEENSLKILKDCGFDIELIKGDSEEEVPKYFKNNNTKFDFVFIDGAHSGEAPYLDMSNTMKHINVGGYMVIDDVALGNVLPSIKKISWEGWIEEDIGESEKLCRIVRREE